jgi:hypothetical protein
MTEKTNETDTPWAPGLDEWWRFTNSGGGAVVDKDAEERAAFRRQRVFRYL